MAQNGFLVPSWYQAVAPSESDMNVASIIWGFSVSCACFTCAKGLRQTWKSWGRTRSVNAYVVMIWMEWLVSVIISIVSWLFLKGIVPVSFWVYFSLLALWVVQIQCIMQIIINRIALLMVNQDKVRSLKLAVFGIIFAINISVFCIWIPARLQINETYISINNVWDRIEKAIIAIVDMGLNFYFIHLIHAKLIANGLTKYTRLYHFNLGMIALSLALDIILIGVMSLPNGIIYVQFHPMCYLVKLHIEMNIADLIARVVRDSNSHSTGSHGNSYSNRHEGSHKMTTLVASRNNLNGSHAKGDEGKGDQDFPASYTGSGIQLTVETQVIREMKVQKDDDEHSESSSTRELQRHFAIV